MLNLITSQTRLNQTTVNPTLENSAITVKEYNEIIPVINNITSGITGGLSGGVADAYTLTLSNIDTPNGLTGKNGLSIDVQFNASNSTASTFNFNGTGVKDIRKNGLDPLSSGDIIVSQVYRIYYDEANDVWILAGQIGTGGGIPSLAGNNVFSGNNTFQAPLTYSAETGITAFAGGGQASATQLTKEFNAITTVATTGDSVKLLAAVAGKTQIVRNNSTRAIDVFPATGDSINSLSVNTAISVAPKATVVFSAIDGTVWLSDNAYIQTPGGLFADSLFENTSGSGINADSVLLKDGGVSNPAETIFADYTPMLIPDDIPAGSGGAIPVNNFFTTVNVDADNDAYTLADATQIGQLKKIFLLTTGGGNAVITPTSMIGGTTVTITAANGYVVLKWSGSGWACIEKISATIA